MRILDRYILRNFLYSTVVWFVVLISLRIVVDLFVNMDEFVSMGDPFLKTVGTIASYYAYHSVEYFADLGGIIIVVSAAFTLAMMNHTNELTAMMASGVSLHRVAWPIIISSLLLSWLIILDRELVLPRLADRLVRDKDEINTFKGRQVRMLTDGDGTVWFAPRYLPADAAMRLPILSLRDSHLRSLGRITAGRAVPGTLDGKRGWYFDPLDEAQEISDAEKIEADKRHEDAKAGRPTPPADAPLLSDKAREDIHAMVVRSTPTLFRNVARRPTFDAGSSLWTSTQPAGGVDASAWKRNPDTVAILSNLGPDEIVEDQQALVREAGKDPKRPEIVFPFGQPGCPVPLILFLPGKRDFVLRLDQGVKDPFYGLTIHGTLSGDDTLIDPRFVFRSEEGRELCTFTAASARWNQAKAGEARWELTGGRLFYPSDLGTEEIVLRMSGQWVDYLSTAQLTELLRLQRVHDKRTALLIRHVRVTEPIDNLIMLLLALPFILSRERNLKASVGLCLLMTGSFLAFIYICRYAQFPAEWTALSAWMPILLFGPVATIMIDSVKT
ncbi:MAG: LptF/LptG family permease [Phycisphaerae bacterium]